MKSLVALVSVLFLVNLGINGFPLEAAEQVSSNQTGNAPPSRSGHVKPTSTPAVEGGAEIGSISTDADLGFMSPARTRRLPVPPKSVPTLGSLRPLSASYEGTGRLSAARPISLVSDHFDGDGVPDLAFGYSGPDGHVLTLHRGNLDSIFPYTHEARARRMNGTFADSPFQLHAQSLAIPVRPDFLVGGDFDNDGHRDLVAASLGGRSLYLLGGDGRGGFREAEANELPGAITALVAGEINRRDALVDLVVAVDGAKGATALLFEGPDGALRREPETLSLPAPASALALGRLVGDYARDLVVAMGSELLIVHGRDRQLTSSRTRRESVAPATQERLVLDRTALGLAIGDFVWDREARTELAVLSDDGTLVVFGRTAEAAPAGLPLKKLLAHRLPQHEAAFESTRAVAPMIFPTRLSGWSMEDLVVLDGAGRRLHIVSGAEPERAARGLDPVRTTSFPLDGSPLAVLPMRLNEDALADLVVLQEASGPGFFLTSIAATITVDTELDSDVAGDGDCSFREAIKNANNDSDVTAGDCVAGAGADAIHFNINGGGIWATIQVVSLLPPIEDSVTIEGSTQACPSSPCIELDGAFTTGLPGLFILTGTSTVRGLVINQFDSRALEVESNGNFIEGNYFGLNLAGTLAIGNGSDGVNVFEASDNTVGGTVAAARNVSAGAGDGQGLQIAGTSATGNQILGNYAGTNKTGTVALGNFYEGAVIFFGNDNTVGGVVPGSRNVLSGNGYSGVLVNEGAENNLIVGNYLGTDVTGSLPLGNATQGAYFLNAPNNTLGSTAVGGRNIIAANEFRGVFVTPEGSAGNKILNNFIGTDVTGTIALGNGLGTYSGIEIDDASGCSVGGTTPSARNVIAANGLGIFLDDPGCTETEVLGNFVGTDVTGTLPLGNSSDGIFNTDGASNNTIGGDEPGAGNVSSANFRGVEISFDSGGNIVQGNHIGVDVTGTVAVGNTDLGMLVHECSNTLIGGATPGAGNVISGNAGLGLQVQGADNPAANNIVQGNFIGTDASGTVAMGNTEFGFLFSGQAMNNVLGGTAPGERNLISANGFSGVTITEGPTGNQVLGNLIGTDITGTRPMGNGHNGLQIRVTSQANTIGGTAPGAGNVISANGMDGIYLGESTSGSTIQGNKIGTDISGTSLLGNQMKGVQIESSGGNYKIGGTAAGAGNIIAGNWEEGIAIISESTGNEFLGNSIFANGLLGIDLVGDGVTANDYQDPDRGANTLQNFPVLASTDATAGSVTINGSLNSRRSSSYRVEFFASSSCDASGYGEGERYLGFLTLATDTNGDAPINAVFPVGVGDGEAVTATATWAGLTQNTSEFSACITASCLQTQPMPQSIGAQDPNTLIWSPAADIRFVKGNLADVSTYLTTGGGWLNGAMSLDISVDQPAPGSGFYYVMRPLACGSWQTAPGAEPARDTALP